MCVVLGGRSRTRHVGNNQHGPVLEKFFFAYQPDPS